jgi:hypothetical protein
MGTSRSVMNTTINPQLLERGGEGDNGSGIIVLTSIIPGIFSVENTEKYSIQKLIQMESLGCPKVKRVFFACSCGIVSGESRSNRLICQTRPS